MEGAPSKGVMGQFVKIDTIATRKVVRLQIECPIEYADTILKELGGFPDPANAQWVGVAPMDVPAESTLKGGELAKMAGILCNDARFKRFCSEQYPYSCGPIEDIIYEECGIKSRAHLDHNEEAARAFRDMKSSYEAWLRT